MFFKGPLKIFLFQAFNLIITISLIISFFVAGHEIIETMPVAHMAALKFLKPQPMDYFWKLNIENAPANKDLIRYYADYYELALNLYPSLTDAYGILGYCYHYLGNDDKTIKLLKLAILYNPLYSWNYYNLASVYIDKFRFQEASQMLDKLQHLDPQVSITRMLDSQIYAPLVEAGGKNSLALMAQHLRASYKVSYLIDNELKKISEQDDVEKLMKKMKLELYAF